MNAAPPVEQEPTNNPGKRTLWHRLLGKLMELGEDIRQLVFDTPSPEDYKQIFASASPEERLPGLGPDQLVALVAQSEAYLRTQKTDTETDAQ